MDKREALKILIEHTFLFDEDTKVRLSDSIPKLSDEEVEAIGKLLALEKKQSMENIDKRIRGLKNTEDKIKRINNLKTTT